MRIMKMIAVLGLSSRKILGVALLIALVTALAACGDKSTPISPQTSIQGTTLEEESRSFGVVSVTTFSLHDSFVPVTLKSPEGAVVVGLEPETIEGPAKFKYISIDKAAIETMPQLPEEISSVTRVFGLTLVGAEATAGEDGAVPALLKPLTITMRYEESDLALVNGDPSFLSVLHLQNQEWIPLLTTVDQENSTISAQVDSLSIFLGATSHIRHNTWVQQSASKRALGLSPAQQIGGPDQQGRPGEPLARGTGGSCCARRAG